MENIVKMLDECVELCELAKELSYKETDEIAFCATTRICNNRFHVYKGLRKLAAAIDTVVKVTTDDENDTELSFVYKGVTFYQCEEDEDL